MALDDQRVQFENALIALFNEIANSGISTGGTILPARLTIINYVKAKLDELIPEGEGITYKLSDAPNISDPYDLIINVHLDEATKDILLSAPLSVLYPTAYPAGSGTAFSDNKTGYIILPDSFLRFVSLRMSDWKTEVTELIDTRHKNYSKQKYSFLRGGLYKPVAVLNWKTISTASKRIIEYYSIDTSHVIDKFFYIPEMVAEDFITANPNLLDSLAWQCAGKIMQIIEKVDLSKVAQERVLQSYNNL